MSSMSRNQLLEYYEEYPFPQDLVTGDSLQYESILYTKQSVRPIIGDASRFEDSFLFEKAVQHPTQGGNTKFSSWRNASQGNVIDNSNEKPAEKNVAKLPKTDPNQQKREIVNDSMDCKEQKKLSPAKINDSMADKDEIIPTNINMTNTSIDNSMKMYNEFFKYPGVSPNQMVGIPLPYPGMYPIIPMKQTEQINIDNIFLFNKKFVYSNDLPAVYIYNPIFKMISGPFSTRAVKEMFIKGQIDSNAEIRLTDVFVLKDHQPFEYVGIKILNDDSWVEMIEDSPILKHTELFTKSKKIVERGGQEKIIHQKLPEEQPKKEKEKANAKIVQQVIKNETLDLGETVIKKEFFETGIQSQLQPAKEEQSNENDDEDSDNDNDNDNENLEIKHIHSAHNKHPEVDINIAKEIDDQEGNWETVTKKKKKVRPNEQMFYLAGNQPKKEKPKKEAKPTQKIDIVPPADLLKSLQPKKEKVKEEEKPNFIAFNDVNPGEAGKKKKKRPQEINVKLGKKIRLIITFPLGFKI